jgi:ATP-dependent DNA helicase RecQ
MKEKNIQEKIFHILKQHWGYTEFRTLQKEIILSILDNRETLNVLPTGGGKSLCFQLPAILKEGMAVVISPLIALMKDQVDGLNEIGVSADYLNSSLSVKDQRTIIERIQKKRLKLLYISPERLQTQATIDLLKSVPLSFFVIDEAHCISHWGHDFRADYRNLRIIKEKFKGIKAHAFTATATKEVQRDIIKELNLEDSLIYAAEVDRPNLTYRAAPRLHILKQITDVLGRHPEESGIIYCLRRDDVDNISDQLNRLGFKNLPYHAGLPDDIRRVHQDKFVREEVDIMVATIAFGMGIDRSNIRFVIHAAMPKSMEHYHQETGRAGRDGLPSYCYMFYGGSEFRTWSFLFEKSQNQSVMMDKLKDIYNFCSRPQCRHKDLARYFGQDYGKGSCDACDYCLGEFDMAEAPLIIGQNVLSCVDAVRFGDDRGFGAGHIADILKGNPTDKIVRWSHNHISNFGSMNDSPIAYIRYMIEQMEGQGFLQRDSEYSTLSVTDSGMGVLRGEIVPALVKPLAAAKKKEISRKRREKKEMEWSGVDQELYHLLRKKRMELAERQGVPAYIIFGDRSLKEMASLKPVTKEAFAAVFGVGERKVEMYAEMFIEIIKQYLSDLQMGSRLQAES